MKKTMKCLVLCLTLLLLTSCSNSMNSADESLEARESSIFEVAEVQNCRIIKDQTNCRAGAGQSFQPITKLNKGDELEVLGQIGDWYVCQLDNNRIGCVNTADATPIVKEGDQQPNEKIIQEPPTNEPTPQPRNGEKIPESSVKGLTTEEAQMLELINGERRKNNLPPLKADLELTRVARIKSQDMIDNNYFSHYSPTYGSPFEMMDNFGIEYLQAGENIASNRTVQGAHEGLMNSSGHRKNILNPNFTHIGLGIKPKARAGLIFTQMFISKPQ